MLIQSRLWRKLDVVLLASVAAIILLGLVVIYSATKPTDLLSVTGESADSFAEIKKQLLWVLLGCGVMVMMLYLYYEDLMKYMKHLYVVNLVMLSSVAFFGVSELGAQRRISMGFFNFQPSEFSKLVIIICFAAFLVTRKKKIESLWDLLPCFAFFAVPILLIMKQPDLGTALVFLAIMFGMLFVSGANPRLLVIVIAVIFCTVSLWIWAHLWLDANRGVHLWIPLQEYQLTRLIIFLDPWQDPLGYGYNVIQSQIAIGQGGFLGRGLFQGSQTHGDFLPIQESDFIFSVVGEEIGFVGAVFLLALYFILIYRCIIITINAKDDFGILIAAGVASMLTCHVLINVGMNSGIMPVTGIPLPLFSYGGSSMITNLASLGLLLGINMRRQRIMF